MAGYGTRQPFIECTNLKLVGTEKKLELQLLNQILGAVGPSKKDVSMINAIVQGKVTDLVSKLPLRQVSHDIDVIAVLQKAFT